MYKKFVYNLDDYLNDVELTDKIIEDLQVFSSCFTVSKVTNLGAGSTTKPAIEFIPVYKDIQNRFINRFCKASDYLYWCFYKAPKTTSYLEYTYYTTISLNTIEVYTNSETKEFLIVINKSLYSFGVFEAENNEHYWLIPNSSIYVKDEKYATTTISDYIYPIDEGSVFLVNIILTYSGRPSTYPLKNCFKCVLSRNIPLGQRCLIDNEEYVEMYNNTSTTRCNLFRYTTD